MKARELMIGDLVYIDDPILEPNFPVRVYSVQTDGYTGPGASFLMEDDEDREAQYNENRIHPIPLTFRILERNGWRRRQLSGVDAAVFSERGTHMVVWLEWREVNKTLFIGDGLLPAPVEYVHQLQHIMRACGIEKEIEL